MNEPLLKDTQSTFSDLHNAIGRFKDEQIDALPFEGSWTPGQVAEHILKAVAGTPQLCMGSTQPAMRPQDQNTPGIRNLFLDYSIQMKSPDFIQPTEKQHVKPQLLSRVKKTEQDFIEIIGSQDLSLLCTDFELPGFGPLTRYEWLDFGLTHTKRHIRQLNNIFKILNPTQ